MAILKEWIEIIGQGIKNPYKVVEGIYNDVKFEQGSLSEDQQNEIIRRRLICESCPHMSENAVAAGNYNTARKDKHCTLCKCPIKSKTASLSSNCGIEVLNKKLRQNFLTLKWEAYKPNKNG